MEHHEVVAVNDNEANVALAVDLSSVINTEIRCGCHTLQLCIHDVLETNVEWQCWDAIL